MTALVAPTPVRPLAPAAVPTFSVIVAAYQAAGTIGEAVESVLAQTLAPQEIIVCDDGSTDDIAGALARFGEKVRLLRQKHRGPGAAKQTAIEMASGEFVVVLDADDLFHPRRLEALGDAVATRPDLDLLTTDALYEIDGVVVHRCYGSPSDFVTKDQRRAILERNFVFGAAAIRRGTLLGVGGFDTSLDRLDDWDCWIRLLLAGSVAGLVNEPLYRYRVRLGSLSVDRAADLHQEVRMLERVRANPHLRPDERPLLERSIRVARNSALLAEAEEAVRHSGRGGRRLLASVAIASGMPARRRLVAISGIVAPRLAAGRLRRQEPHDRLREAAITEEHLVNRGGRPSNNRAPSSGPSSRDPL
jgi:glycosyltransferase involved in cell wall biosynthesis